MELNQLYRYVNKGDSQMQLFLLIIILILIITVVYQGKEIRDLERKTLDAFKIVCQKIKPKK